MSQTKMGAHVTISPVGEDGFLPSQKDIELFELLDLIIKKNLPLSVVEDSDFRQVWFLFPTIAIMKRSLTTYYVLTSHR